MTERFPTIPLEAMTPQQRAVNDEICAGPRGSLIGPFKVLLHAPELESRIHRIGEYLRFECSLPKDVIELVVLYTATRWKCHFEWVIHSEIGRKYGLNETTLDALHSGSEPENMTEQQSAAWHFAHDVHRTGEASDASFAAANQLFGRQGVLELLALCGYYSTLAMILNTARFMPEQGRVYPDA
ncbi:carboxymuconolactone decarboxylase family protein [Hydrogenophaga sp.]|uniref:carboxymuconolactone decarboxylase family protein n=1 Tax=Hydrogenophaga sp. TaxID=1904254 RepID=UPI003F6F964A